MSRLKRAGGWCEPVGEFAVYCSRSFPPEHVSRAGRQAPLAADDPHGIAEGRAGNRRLNQGGIAIIRP